MSTPIEKIKQETFQITQDKNYHELINQLVERNGSILVFVKTKHGAPCLVLTKTNIEPFLSTNWFINSW